MSIIGFIVLVLIVLFVLYLINVCFDNPQTRNILRIITFIITVLILLIMVGLIPASIFGTRFTVH